MTSDSLKQVFSTYNYLKDSVKVTKLSIDKSINQLHRNTIFYDKQTKDPNEIIEKIKLVALELDDIMILSLFASFERELRTSIQNILSRAINENDQIIVKLKLLTSYSIERWAMNDIIDAFDGIVENDVRNKTKQIYKYRNWVAHGKNKDNPPSTRIDSKTAFLVLYEFITQASKVVMEKGLE